MSKKFKFSINGTEFQLPVTQIRDDNYDGGKYIYMNAKSCASIIKQFVKKNYPSLKVWATSDVYSGGSSVRVEVSNQDGSKVDSSIFDKISNWKHILQGGNFNGMIDMYEYREDSPTTDNGTPMKYFPSYVFIDNKPKWGSLEYWLNDWNENKKYFKDLSDFLSKNKTYMSDKEYKKVDVALTSVYVSEVLI
jgi:hypothetical protein